MIALLSQDKCLFKVCFGFFILIQFLQKSGHLNVPPQLVIPECTTLSCCYHMNSRSDLMLSNPCLAKICSAWRSMSTAAG